MLKKNFSWALYGFGDRGKDIYRQLLAHDILVDIIIDKSVQGVTDEGVRIITLEEAKKTDLSHKLCVISMHNNFVDIVDLAIELKLAGFYDVISLVQLAKQYTWLSIYNGYWLDTEFSYEKNESSFEKFINCLSDEKSKIITKQIISYRQNGEINNCPIPSFLDEYVPIDLPRHPEKLKLIDCGAYTGVAIDKFLASGYTIDEVYAFEPDPNSFGKLAENIPNGMRATLMPLATWSENKQLKFKANSTMGSSLSDEGEDIIQCVKLDHIIKGWKPNLIKFDVEGAEYETLLGAEELIRCEKPNLCVSAYHRPEHLFNLGLLIDSWNLGYKFHLRVHEWNTFGCVLYCFQNT